MQPGDYLIEEPLTPTSIPRKLVSELIPQLNKRLTATGTCVGDPRIRAGDVLRIEGVGEEFGGLYRVTAVTHTLDGGGFRTQLRGAQGNLVRLDPARRPGRGSGARCLSEETTPWRTKQSSSAATQELRAASRRTKKIYGVTVAHGAQQHRLHRRGARAADAAVAAGLHAVGAGVDADGRHGARHATSCRRSATRCWSPSITATCASPTSSARCGTRSTGRRRCRRPTRSPSARSARRSATSCRSTRRLQSVTLTRNTHVDGHARSDQGRAQHAAGHGDDRQGRRRDDHRRDQADARRAGRSRSRPTSCSPSRATAPRASKAGGDCAVQGALVKIN